VIARATARNLCLHYVAEAAARRLTISAAALRALVRREREEGRNAASLIEYVTVPPGVDRFTLSFDDAHVSLRAHALPILRELDVPATVFVPTSYVETSHDFSSWEDLRALRDAGWTIGSHTHTHPRLGTRLYDEDERAHRERVRGEIERSFDLLARELGVHTRLFAYPYGEDPPLVREIARACGAIAFTVREDLAWDGDLASIPRVDAMAPSVAIEEPTPISVIVPSKDRARILADVVTRLASQSYPKDRYEVIVVDDGSSDDPSPIFREMPPNVRLIRQGDDRFRAGQARQRGADEARFTHLAFLDADVAVEPDFLWHLDWIHRREEDAVILGYLSGYNLCDQGFLHTPDETIGKDLRALPLIPDRSREPTLRRCLDNLDWIETPWPLTYTGNLSLPKALLDRIGGFAREFEAWGLEDIDLGIRLSRAGGHFVFSRFAVGRHMVDPEESASRNPFRATRPTRDRFASYLANLEILRRRHAEDPAVLAYVARSIADIDESCARPLTVGIEMGGEAEVRSRHHRAIHRVQPGGVPRHELLDRVEYARKTGAKTIYMLGGEPLDHPAFFDVLARASEIVSWVSIESAVHPFADRSLAARARENGLRGVVAIVHAFDPAIHDALHGPSTYERFERGLDALREAGIELSARLVVSHESIPAIERTTAELARRGMKIVELSETEPGLASPFSESANMAGSRVQ
jgi:peptidoglycan/xylan/chitin deacetylase (PgdA/CDA1 family)/glycosyltransferase involved in cell wall biosynthesis